MSFNLTALTKEQFLAHRFDLRSSEDLQDTLPTLPSDLVERELNNWKKVQIKQQSLHASQKDLRRLES